MFCLVPVCIADNETLQIAVIGPMSGKDQEGGPLQGPLKGEYGTNAIQFFAINLIWKF
jgi:hypothetical protein